MRAIEGEGSEIDSVSADGLETGAGEKKCPDEPCNSSFEELFSEMGSVQQRFVCDMDMDRTSSLV